MENQLNIDETDVNQTDVNQTDVNQTDVNQTDVNQTDVNQTDVNQTDVSVEHGKAVFTEETILKVINLVSEKSSLKILKMLPSNEETVKDTLELSDYTYYRKMKRFQKNGLVKTNAETNKEETTELGRYMIESMDSVIDGWGV